MNYYNILAVFVLGVVALVSAVPVPEPLFWKPHHEHHVIHVPTVTKHIHHHHVKKVPVLVKSHEYIPVSTGWSASAWPSASVGWPSAGWW